MRRGLHQLSVLLLSGSAAVAQQSVSVTTQHNEEGIIPGHGCHERCVYARHEHAGRPALALRRWKQGRHGHHLGYPSNWLPAQRQLHRQDRSQVLV